ncbi:30S ribosomal protein S7 [Planctomycetes bacterium Pan216]|uniref:Small ribosomal subunit protein uS7 n=2 Tax=Kolteria novifilia TaxID=2527975 RepID=A0A518B966_9BACT|nr:30S ribosomal protein S7 [Planctomycetes bacterium Pan216]
MTMRKPTASRSQLRPDARFNSRLVSKFVNCMMWDGKKTTAIRIFYRAMDEMERRLSTRGGPGEGGILEVFLQAVDNVKPAVEIQSKRVGGATYQVPVRVSTERQQALAIRWIIQAARGKKGRPMHLKLADELLAAYRREGEAMTKRENVHRMADANKAFAHFAH